MLFRLLLLVMATSVLAIAEESPALHNQFEDAQQSGLENSMKRRFADSFRSSMSPSGFQSQQPTQERITIAPADPRLLSQTSSVTVTLGIPACAIPLQETAIPKDKKFAMEYVKPDKSFRDSMVYAPATPACTE